MRSTVKIHIVMLSLLTAIGGTSANTVFSSTGDTIPSRYRNYYYTSWYDECPEYHNDTCCHERYYLMKNQGPQVKYEYTHQRLKVLGLAAMVDDESSYHSVNPYRGPTYLYLLKRLDTVDTVMPPTAHVFHYRTRILDSLRWDTVVPRVMEIEQGNPRLAPVYSHVYEVYFDKPIEVDSEFYLYGSQQNQRVWNEETQFWSAWTEFRPTYYYYINHIGHHPAGCQPMSTSDSVYCQFSTLRGEFHSMTYQGYGLPYSNPAHPEWQYPVTDDVWLQTSSIFLKDPFGIYFAIVENFKLDVYSDSLRMGDVDGGGIYYNSDGTEIRAIPHAGYIFSHWNDGNTDNPRIVHLTQDTSFTAYFDTGAYYALYTAVNNRGWGAVEGGGTYAVNTEVELTAVPTEGFMFERWDDGDIQNPRTVTVTHDTLFTAVFALDTTTTGIPEAGRLAFGIAPNPTGGRLTVTLADDSPCEAEVYDATGRCVLRATLQGPQSDLDVRRLPAGRYLLRLTSGDKSGIKVFVRK